MRIDFKNCYYATFYDDNITISLHFNMKDKKQAKKYNKSVNKNNDYWHRFVIEDRSEWLIDINKYLEDKSE